jgi:hypothetical protein
LPTATPTATSTATPTLTPTLIVQGVAPTPTLTPLPGYVPAPSYQGNVDDGPRRLTEEQRRHRQHTNAGNEDDYHTEGNVAAVERDGDTLTILVGMRDGTQRVVLSCSVSSPCPDVRPGDYIEAEGVKENEALFYADEVTVTRNGRRVRT